MTAAKNFLLTEPWPLNASTIIKLFDLHTINVLMALASNYRSFFFLLFLTKDLRLDSYICAWLSANYVGTTRTKH